MKLFYLVIFLLTAQFVFAQDNYEIQVYGAETLEKRTTIFELHSNFTFNGEKNIIDGVRPSHHALHETIEITHGFTDNFEIGFYIFTNYTAPYGYQYVGSHIRPRIAAPEKWKLPVGLSLSGEIGFQKQEYAADTWSVELRPIIDKQWNKFYVSFNPTLGISLKGANQHSAPSFEPNIKASYNFFKNASLGIEYYGSMGPLNQFDKLPEQNHALFLVYDMLNNENWELNGGPGFGLTDATDKLVFKILAGRKIKWHKKSAR